jgi:hypothetical protein
MRYQLAPGNNNSSMDKFCFSSFTSDAAAALSEIFFPSRERFFDESPPFVNLGLWGDLDWLGTDLGAGAEAPLPRRSEPDALDCLPLELIPIDLEQLRKDKITDGKTMRVFKDQNVEHGQRTDDRTTKRKIGGTKKIGEEILTDVENEI